jgi:hypothetical protein
MLDMWSNPGRLRIVNLRDYSSRGLNKYGGDVDSGLAVSAIYVGALDFSDSTRLHLSEISLTSFTLALFYIFIAPFVTRVSVLIEA